MFWLVGPDGNYDEEHRAKLFANGSGQYKFESNFPTRYTEPPHIHVYAMAQGYRGLTTQYFPANDQQSGVFDLQLEPDAIWSLLFFR